MPNSTSRLALIQPVGADAASELRVAITANATTLDPSVLMTSGTISSRPAATSVAVGNEYYATDTAQWFKSNGSVWMLTAAADTGWLNITVSVGAAWTFSAPQARQIGNQVFIRGGWMFTSTTPANDTTLGMLPGGIAQPAATFALFGANVAGPSAVINNSGTGYIDGGTVILSSSFYAGTASTSYFLINDFSYLTT